MIIFNIVLVFGFIGIDHNPLQFAGFYFIGESGFDGFGGISLDLFA